MITSYPCTCTLHQENFMRMTSNITENGQQKEIVSDDDMKAKI